MRRHEAGSVHVNGWVPVLAALVLAAALAGPASAATFVVNSTADTLDANVGNGVCLTSAGTCTLRAAIQEANAQSNADVIQVPAGIYSLVRTGGGNTAGDFDIIRPLTIAGAGAGVTILDGGQPPPGSPPSRPGLDRLVDVSSGAGNVTLSGLTLREGWTSDEGGAVRIFSRGLVRLDGVAVVDSSAGTLGGAVYAANTVSTLGARPRLELVGTTIARNRAGSGGGVFVGLDADFTLSSSTIADNAATGDGGGLAAVTRSSVVARLSTLQGNTAGGSGGGAFTSTTRPVTIDAALAGGNASLLDGGGLWSAGAGGVTVTKSTFVGNTSGAGGGAASVGGAAVLENTTASGNSAAASGGGIRARAGASLRLVSTTVFANSAALGGGLAHAGGPVILRNTIVAGSPVSGTCSGVVSSEGGNIDAGTTCALGGPGDRSSTDPLLEPLADNGGPAPTHALRATSPAVDAGVSPCPATDQRGISRPQNAGCDIGAYELVGVPDPPDTSPPETTVGAGPPATTTATAATFTFSASESGSSFECALDGAAFAPCGSPYELSGLAVGGHSFAVRATDAAGNADPTPAVYSWTVEPLPDTTPPETTIDAGPPATTRATAATFVFSASEAGSSFECALDGAAFAACVSPHEVSGLAVGAHTLAVRATDAAGNTDASPASYAWTVEPPPDTTPPETTIDSGPPATTTASTATFAFSASEAGSTFECSLDGAPFSSCSSPLEVSGLAVGGHELAVRAIDTAGNTDPTPAAYSWTVEAPPDTIPPETTIESGPPATTAETTATFTFSSSESGSSFECALDGAAFAPCGLPHEVAGLAVGGHSFAIRATDAAGNTDPSPAAYSWTVEPPPDTTPPETTIDSGPPATTTATSAGLAFSAGEEEATFECSLDGAPFAACASPLTLTGLGVGAHSFSVRATDSDDNTDPSPAVHDWTVVEVTCEPMTVTAPIQADAWVDELTPVLNGGTDATLAVESSAAGGTARAYVRFALPSQIPDGCVVRSARLRLYTDSAGEGYTFEAQALGSAWTESGVTWSNQPQAAGTASIAWSRGGYMHWNVTAQVAAGLDAVRNGFVVRAAGEGTDAAGAIGFNAREKAENPPELVIHFAAPDTDDPPDPPAPPQPEAVTCGQVLTESTLVTNDLAECPEDGLVIGAPRIVVDLGGHTVDGVGLGTGIANDGHAGVTVRNGTVQQFDHGVLLLAETRGNLLEGLTVQLNEVSGIELFTAGAAAEGNEVRGNTVAGNGGGIATVSGTIGTLVTGNTLTGNGGGALVVRDSTGNRLEHNVISGGGDLGVEIERASDNVLLGNTVSGTSDGGIEVVAGSHDNLVQGNTVDASGDMGILVSESNRNRLVGNVTHGMSDSGISLSSANDGVVRENDLRLNPGGLQMDGSSRNLISGNDASETTGYGIEVGGGSFDNDVVENRAVGNAAAGIYVSDEALAEPGNRVARNTANGNGGDGILLAKGGHVVTANITRDNVGWGISAAPGSVDGGGNVATGNGASGGQCSGVACTDGSTPPPPDTTPPETTIDTGPVSPTTDSAASFTFSASEAGAAFECSLDGAAFALCTSPLSVAGLGAGDHELRVRATDPAGNIDGTPAAYLWTILPESPCEAATAVVDAEADSWILQSSSGSNYGNDSVIKVDSKSGANARVLVRFSLPALEPGCRVVAAQLRLNASSAKEGRSLQAVRAAAGWAEGSVTWANQPAATGTVATARSAEGYVEWAVAAQVAAMYSQGNFGFLVLDASENGDGIEQGFHSREKGEDGPPQLILTFG